MLESYLITGGDACILAAAFFYSLATVRLSRLAANVSSLELATSKSLALAIISLGWVGVSAASQVALSSTSCTCSHDALSIKNCCKIVPHQISDRNVQY